MTEAALTLSSAQQAAFLDAERLPPNYWRVNGAMLAKLAEEIGRRKAEPGGTILAGLCGPQGSGKSTTAKALALLLGAGGLRPCVLSLDDIYLTRAERLVLARDVHPLLATRGPPGTHDISLGLRVLDALGDATTTRIPTFDKASDNRAPAPAWPVFEGPADVVIFEGWCVGAVPQTPDELLRPINDLEKDEDPDGRWRGFVNAALARYQTLFSRIDHLTLLRPPGFEVVHRWRCEQEHKLGATRHGADAAELMSDAAIARFIQHYERLTRHIIAEMPARATTTIELDHERRPIPKS